jgi:type VI secretion system secreted protein VgrG
MARMRTNFAVGAGQALTVTGAEAQGTWLVVRAAAELDGTAPHRTGSTYEIEAIPIAVPFRPRPIKRPRIFGIQSATVVGTTPAGTVDVDEHGRVTLLFPWDRRGHTAGHLTRRVRVAQAWAGQAYGVDTWPRVGDEVLVAFEEGNPDAPIVIGRLHNAVSVPSFKPSGEGNTVSSWKSQSFGPEGPVDGFNLILMADAAGAERLALRAQLDFRCDTHRNSDTTVGNNQSLRVAGSQSTTVRGGQSTSVGGAASTTAGEISVKSKGLYVLHGGFVSLNGEGFLGLSAANGERLDLSGVKHHFGSPEIYLHGKNVVQVVTENFHVFAGTEVLLKVGGSSIRLTAGGIDIESSGDVKINGATVKLNC